jgi:hypothetical protein
LGQIGNYLFKFISTVMAPRTSIAADGENGLSGSEADVLP